MKYWSILGAGLLLGLCACHAGRHLPKNTSQMRAIDLFEQYITGDFDNRRQVDAEIQTGQQVHPYAVHINRRADDKIIGAPARDGFWLLEESYYARPDGSTEVKPYLFFFEAVGDTGVLLRVYKTPPHLPASDLVNANTQLKIPYSELEPSPSFKPAQYRREGNTFRIHAPNDLGNGMRFTLIETFYPDRLEVMELLEKDGVRLTPYDTPIIYDRRR